MKSRFLYMKFLGLLFVLVGFSYSITSFNNFFGYIFDYKIFVENLNIYVMTIGLILPLYVFIYGIYFYFYTDFNITKINIFILLSNLSLLVIGAWMAIFTKTSGYFDFWFLQIFAFIHPTFAYCLVFLSLMGIYGCFKYKF